MKSQQPDGAHHALMNDLKSALARHSQLSDQEMLAVTAQLVGQLVAAQDHTRFSAREVMNMVAANVEKGNQMAISHLMVTRGSA